MINWQPIASAPREQGRQVLLGRSGWGAVLAEWYEGAWLEHLGGELYGTVVRFEPTHWADVSTPPK